MATGCRTTLVSALRQRVFFAGRFVRADEPLWRRRGGGDVARPLGHAKEVLERPHGRVIRRERRVPVLRGTSPPPDAPPGAAPPPPRNRGPRGPRGGVATNTHICHVLPVKVCLGIKPRSVRSVIIRYVWILNPRVLNRDRAGCSGPVCPSLEDPEPGSWVYLKKTAQSTTTPTRTRRRDDDDDGPTRHRTRLSMDSSDESDDDQ